METKDKIIVGVVISVVLIGIVVVMTLTSKEGFEATDQLYFNNFTVAGGKLMIDNKKVKFDNLKLVSNSKNKIIVKGSHPLITFSGPEKKIPLKSDLGAGIVMIIKGNGDFEILREKAGQMERIQLDAITFSTDEFMV